MFENYIIEIDDSVAGIVVREGARFRFFSAHRTFDCLEGHLFASPRHAEREALIHSAPVGPDKAVMRHGERRQTFSA